LTSIEQKLQTAKQNIEELNNSLDVDSVKNNIENKVKSRDKMEASLSAIDDEISSLHKLSSLTAEFELKKSTLQAKKEELENLKKKHGDKIKELLDTQELQEIKLKSALERIQQRLVCDTFSRSV
jgi:exonuclease VII large subunit